MIHRRIRDRILTAARRVSDRAGSLVRALAALDRPSLVLVLALFGLVAGAFGGFLVQSVWTPTLLYGLLAVAGIGWVTRQALTAKVLTFLMTAMALSTLGLIAVFLGLEAIPAFRTVGLDLIWPFGDTTWDAAQNQYSLVPMLWGTVLTTAVAVVVAAPAGIAGALFISDIAPAWLREIVKPGVEILAGIPSIVYGFIGFTVINPTSPTCWRSTPAR